MHKEKLDKVHNALPGRDSTEVEIYGMEGIPEEDVIAHEKKGANQAPSSTVGNDHFQLHISLVYPLVKLSLVAFNCV